MTQPTQRDLMAIEAEMVRAVAEVRREQFAAAAQRTAREYWPARANAAELRLSRTRRAMWWMAALLGPLAPFGVVKIAELISGWMR